MVDRPKQIKQRFRSFRTSHLSLDGIGIYVIFKRCFRQFGDTANQADNDETPQQPSANVSGEPKPSKTPIDPNRSSSPDNKTAASKKGLPTASAPSKHISRDHVTSGVRPYPGACGVVEHVPLFSVADAKVDLQAPLFPSVHRDLITEKTLKQNDLRWEPDKQKPDNIVILRELSDRGLEKPPNHSANRHRSSSSGDNETLPVTNDSEAKRALERKVSEVRELERRLTREPSRWSRAQSNIFDQNPVTDPTRSMSPPATPFMRGKDPALVSEYHGPVTSQGSTLSGSSYFPQSSAVPRVSYSSQNIAVPNFPYDSQGFAPRAFPYPSTAPPLPPPSSSYGGLYPYLDPYLEPQLVPYQDPTFSHRAFQPPPSARLPHRSSSQREASTYGYPECSDLPRGIVIYSDTSGSEEPTLSHSRKSYVRARNQKGQLGPVHRSRKREREITIAKEIREQRKNEREEAAKREAVITLEGEHEYKPKLKHEELSVTERNYSPRRSNRSYRTDIREPHVIRSEISGNEVNDDHPAINVVERCAGDKVNTNDTKRRLDEKEIWKPSSLQKPRQRRESERLDSSSLNAEAITRQCAPSESRPPKTVVSRRGRSRDSKFPPHRRHRGYETSDRKNISSDSLLEVCTAAEKQTRMHSSPSDLSRRAAPRRPHEEHPPSDELSYSHAPQEGSQSASQRSAALLEQWTGKITGVSVEDVDEDENKSEDEDGDEIY